MMSKNITQCSCRRRQEQTGRYGVPSSRDRPKQRNAAKWFPQLVQRVLLLGLFVVPAFSVSPVLERLAREIGLPNKVIARDSASSRRRLPDHEVSPSAFKADLDSRRVAIRHVKRKETANWAFPKYYDEKFGFLQRDETLEYQDYVKSEEILTLLKGLEVTHVIPFSEDFPDDASAEVKKQMKWNDTMDANALTVFDMLFRHWSVIIVTKSKKEFKFIRVDFAADTAGLSGGSEAQGINYKFNVWGLGNDKDVLRPDIKDAFENKKGIDNKFSVGEKKTLADLLQSGVGLACGHGYFTPESMTNAVSNLWHQFAGFGGKATLTCQEMTMFFCLNTGVWNPSKKSKIWRAFVGFCSNPVKGFFRGVCALGSGIRRLVTRSKKPKMSPKDVASFNKLHFMDDKHHYYKEEGKDTLHYTKLKQRLNKWSKVPFGKALQLIGMIPVMIFSGSACWNNNRKKKTKFKCDQMEKHKIYEEGEIIEAKYPFGDDDRVGRDEWCKAKYLRMVDTTFNALVEFVDDRCKGQAGDVKIDNVRKL